MRRGESSSTAFRSTVSSIFTTKWHNETTNWMTVLHQPAPRMEQPAGAEWHLLEPLTTFSPRLLQL